MKPVAAKFIFFIFEMIILHKRDEVESIRKCL